ncbi:MAG: hypothetical protein GXO87_02205 [Chlorobi bacterium]|nr:hypothetical protein [Chlorobiota bacterium]
MKTKIIYIFFAAFLFTSCGGEKIKSKWADFDIKIDGKIEDWEGKLLYFKDEQAALGVANDGSFLYLALSTRERSSYMQALTGGLIIWFKNEDSDSKKIGIIFPIGNKTDFSSMRKKHEAGNDDDQMISAIIRSQDELSIVDEDSYPLALLNIENNKNVKIAINLEKNVFYYELKIPLKISKETPYAIDANPVDHISVEIESMQSEMSNGRPEHTGMRGGGLSGGGGGMRGSGMSGGGRMNPGGSMNNSRMEPIEISLDVALARPDSSK